MHFTQEQDQPQFLTELIRTQSLHYFHAIPVQDRVNMASLSEIPQPQLQIDPAALPSEQDFHKLRQECGCIGVKVTNIMICIHGCV